MAKVETINAQWLHWQQHQQFCLASGACINAVTMFDAASIGITTIAGFK